MTPILTNVAVGARVLVVVVWRVLIVVPPISIGIAVWHRNRRAAAECYRPKD
jgi:hypothetical protein